MHYGSHGERVLSCLFRHSISLLSARDIPTVLLSLPLLRRVINAGYSNKRVAESTSPFPVSPGEGLMEWAAKHEHNLSFVDRL